MTALKRIRRISPTQLADVITKHDPQYYSRDWQARFVYTLRNAMVSRITFAANRIAICRRWQLFAGHDARFTSSGRFEAATGQQAGFLCGLTVEVEQSDFAGSAESSGEEQASKK